MPSSQTVNLIEQLANPLRQLNCALRIEKAYVNCEGVLADSAALETY